MSSALISTDTFARTVDIRRAARAVVWSAVRTGVKDAVLGLATWVAERRRVKSAIVELSGLSDRMLKDIGVPRHDIPRVAQFGRDASDVRSEFV